MKQISILLIIVLALSCKKESKTVATENTTTTQNSTQKRIAETVKNTTSIAFLEDVKTLERDTSKNPIETFKKQAEGTVKEIIKINKDNIVEALAKAKKFKYAVITVEKHTIIKITDLSNCKPSGSWSACMPIGEGYIKKGELQYQNNFINNIIGFPDDKERLLYLF